MHEIAVPLHHFGGLLLAPKGGSTNDSVNGMQLEPELGYNAKISTTTSYGPEEILVFLSTDCHEATVGQYHVCRQQIVNRESVLAGQIPMSTSEC